MNGTLENVKVGDKLFVSHRWSRGIETVIKVTKLHVITETGKYRKTGYSVGDGWTCSYARPATDEDIENVRKEVARQNILHSCRNINFDSLSDSQLEAILKIVKQEV